MSTEPSLLPAELDSLSSLLSDTKRQLNNEIKVRSHCIKFLEQTIRALKDPHKNAVALSEAVTALERPFPDLALPDSFPSIIQQIKHLAEEKLSELEFTFARDLREAFQAKGITLDGPPTRLIANLFLIEPNLRKRQVYMSFSRQPVTNKVIKLDVEQVVTAYERAYRDICERKVNLEELLAELFETWQRLVLLGPKQTGKVQRVGIVECYRELVLVRQPLSFLKTPSKQNFVDYPKTHFIYDVLQLRRSNMLMHNGYKMNLGTATIDVTGDSTRAMFLATSAVEGAIIKDIYFTQEP